jgi:hypothetical protein
MKSTDPTKNRGWTQVLTKSKQFLLLVRHLPCFSYIQSKNTVEINWYLQKF